MLSLLFICESNSGIMIIYVIIIIVNNLGGVEMGGGWGEDSVTV